MSDEIKPALTPEEWKAALRDRAGMAAAMQRAWGNGEHRENDHALAALALVLQPFGFNDGHLLLLRTIARVLRKEGHTAEPDHLERLAERIEALLPPP